MTVKSRARRISIVAAFLLAAAQATAMTPMGTTAVRADTVYATRTLLELDPAAPVYSQQLTLVAHVLETGPDYSLTSPGGSVEFTDHSVTPATSLGLSSVLPDGPGTGIASLVLPSGLALGDHSLVAEYVTPDAIHSSSISDAVALTMTKVASETYVDPVPQTEAHHPVAFHAYVLSPVDGWEANATVTFHAVGSSAPGCTASITTNPVSCAVSSLPVGTYSYAATYSGNAIVAGSTSATVSVTIVPDVVHASSIAVQYSTFYPVVDTYRDTNKISGYRSEPISVAIRVQNWNGTTVRTASMTRATGAYSYAWNGRLSDGTLLAAGTYKITQTLTDAAGTKLVSVKYTTLSHKKLYYYATYLTKYATSLSAKGTSGSASLTKTSSGYLRLSAPTSGSSWVGAGWQFTIPSATVYRSIKFQAYSKGPLWAGGRNYIGVQNFHTCAYTSSTTWYDTCFERWVGVGNSTNSWSWKSTTASPTYDRSGTVVRGMAQVTIGTYYLYKVRVYVNYGLLK